MLKKSTSLKVDIRIDYVNITACKIKIYLIAVLILNVKLLSKLKQNGEN